MNQEEITNLRAAFSALADTQVVPIGAEFLGTLLGSLHIAVQLLDVIYAEKRDAVIALEDREVSVGDFSMLVNTLLNVANEKLQLPEHLKNS